MDNGQGAFTTHYTPNIISSALSLMCQAKQNYDDDFYETDRHCPTIVLVAVVSVWPSGPVESIKIQ